MTHWSAVYSDAQRRAIERAYCELRIRPVAQIVRMAAAGELRAEPDDVDPLEPFEIPYSSALTIAKAAERRKAGKLRGELARQSPRDRAQTLQQRLTAVVDREVERMEKQRKPVDLEQIRKCARALRELATVPDELRLPRATGTPREDGRTPDGASTDTLAGRILAASDASVSPSVRERINGRGTSSAERINAATSDENEQHADSHDGEQAPCAPQRASVGAYADVGRTFVLVPPA